jgi:two-component system nitrogen regulation response regulator NtrX
MLNTSSPGKQSPVHLIGRSEAIRAIEADVECAARSDAKVLITGETGVGKEVVARLIHQRSQRSGAPLVALNCAGLPDSLLESELFGHARGSFTGAYRDKPGLLEMGHSGTVFLDEVGDMSARMQVVLLRFLETGEIQRVGGDRTHTRVNVRLITATNRDLPNQIVAGAFREDLYFRLNVIRICIPPLRDRIDDIELLIDHFLDSYSAQHRVPRPELSSGAVDALVTYRWPGNIRELKNVVERLVLRAGGQTISAADLPKDTFRSPQSSVAVAVESAAAPPAVSTADELSTRMLVQGESFWSAVYPSFMSRDITRNDLRRIVHIGLETTNGNYRLLVQLFNMPLEDYKRFLSFLRKYDCHLPFQKFRTAASRVTPAVRGVPRRSGGLTAN